jgi:hypothetical protein
MALGESAAETVAEIQLSDNPFNMLAIPEDKVSVSNLLLKVESVQRCNCRSKIRRHE